MEGPEEALPKPNLDQPVLEVTFLSIKSPYTSVSPEILTTLQQTREAIAEKVTPTNSRFFLDCSPAADEVLILGIWPSLKRHEEFLADDVVRKEILGAQEDMFNLKGGTHIEISSDDTRRIKVLLCSSKTLQLSEFKNCKGIEKFGWLLEEDRKRFEIAKGREKGIIGRETFYVRIVGWRNIDDYDKAFYNSPGMQESDGSSFWEVGKVWKGSNMEA
jgi:hypothetical protein